MSQKWFLYYAFVTFKYFEYFIIYMLSLPWKDFFFLQNFKRLITSPVYFIGQVSV